MVSWNGWTPRTTHIASGGSAIIAWLHALTARINQTKRSDTSRSYGVLTGDYYAVKNSHGEIGGGCFKARPPGIWTGAGYWTEARKGWTALSPEANLRRQYVNAASLMFLGSIKSIVAHPKLSVRNHAIARVGKADGRAPATLGAMRDHRQRA